MSKRISRSTFLKSMAGAAAGTVIGTWWHQLGQSRPAIACRMLGPNRTIGHKIRDAAMSNLTLPEAAEETTVAIIGGGIAGLSAAWWLKRSGFNDFVLLELEPEVGGNARSGSNQVSAYPWGAHYVPLANSESEFVQILFGELNIIQGTDSQGRAIYNDLYLCHEPQERLFKDGVFAEGLVPKRGLQPGDQEQLQRFFGRMQEFRIALGKDGRPAFAIPLDLSSTDSKYRDLDNISMAEWLSQESFDSKPLLWYANYCCRDDYGSALNNVSAWAGIHYFAGRRGQAANAEMNSVVTWPEGNGFLVHALRAKLSQHLRTDAAVFRTEPDSKGAKIFYVDSGTGKLSALRSQYLVFAAPRFLAKHILETSVPEETHPVDLEYAPWMVANVTVKRMPPAHGVPLSWDNVSYQSDSLGYVVANHQNISTRQGPAVLTWYYPLSSKEPAAARAQLLQDTATMWSTLVINDLEKMHPDIASAIESIDFWPWGHGMIRPSIGYIWGEERRRLKEPKGKVVFAHSDMSGISNFEEAQYHGILAAQHILCKLGIPQAP